MTPLSHLFVTYKPCANIRKVAVVDGSLTTVAGIGNVRLGPKFKLQNVLHFPKLITLVSIHNSPKICTVMWFFNFPHVSFKIRIQGRRLGLLGR